MCEFFKGRYSLTHLFHRLLKKNMYASMMSFIIFSTTLTRNVNESKWGLLKHWGLKPLNFGNALKIINIYYPRKDSKKH